MNVYHVFASVLLLMKAQYRICANSYLLILSVPLWTHEAVKHHTPILVHFLLPVTIPHSCSSSLSFSNVRIHVFLGLPRFLLHSGAQVSAKLMLPRASLRSIWSIHFHLISLTVRQREGHSVCSFIKLYIGDLFRPVNFPIYSEGICVEKCQAFPHRPL